MMMMINNFLYIYFSLTLLTNHCTRISPQKSKGGINICLNTFLGFCEKHIGMQLKKQPENVVFLNVKKLLREESPEERQEKEKQRQQQQQQAPTKLAIGVEGGFAMDSLDPEANRVYDELYSLIVLGSVNKIIPLPADLLTQSADVENKHLGIPAKLWESMKGVQREESSERKEELHAWELDEDVKLSRFARDLVQVRDESVPHPMPSGGWKCCKCDLSEDNVWMCLTCGVISCGRRHWDGTGGNNHGVEHYEQTGHPLVVKLGTIDAKSNVDKVKADVFSYPEGDMVEDPDLVKHLEFFGIRVSEMQKTSKTMAELNLDVNVNYDFNRIQEEGKELEPLFGPGYTGLTNLGNSCYINSVMQTLMMIPSFQKRYLDLDFSNSFDASTDVPNDLNVQMTKLANGLLSGEYSAPLTPEVDDGDDKKTAYQEGIAINMFKHLVGRGHPEFSTNRQQDAVEFFQYLLQLIERAETSNKLKDPNCKTFDPAHVLKFMAEDRKQDIETSKVQYLTPRVDNILSVDVPLDRATNREEYDTYLAREKEKKQQGQATGQVEYVAEGDEHTIEQTKRQATDVEPPVRPRVPMSECIKLLAQPEMMSLHNPLFGKPTPMHKISRIINSPDYLLVCVKRFTLGEGWIPKKLDVFIEAAEEIDIAELKKEQPQVGPLEGDDLLPESEQELQQQQQEEQEIHIDQTIVAELLSMGFPQNRAEKAAFKTNNQGSEEAMNWLLDHMEDADIDEPLAPSSTKTGPSEEGSQVDEEKVMTLMGMGFDRERCIVALQQTGDNLERAGDWIFSHMDDDLSQFSSPSSAATATATSSQDQTKDQWDQQLQQLTNAASTKYELVGFISHIGSNTASGHYVCHLKKDERWVIFNDRKVAVSSDPPIDMGYMYLYRRRD